MEDFIKVKDRDKLVRDRTSNAIVNLDFDDFLFEAFLALINLSAALKLPIALFDLLPSM